MNHPLATTSTSTHALSAKAAALTQDFLERLGSIVGKSKLGQAIGSVNPDLALQAWYAGLADLTSAELERGLRACLSRQWAPTIGEFRLLCRPSLDPETAWLEAHDGLAARARGRVGEWSHPAVWRAACAMGYEIRTGNYATCRKRWERVLEREFAAGWGDDVPPVSKSITNAATAKAMPPEIRSQLAQLSAKLSGKKTS